MCVCVCVCVCLCMYVCLCVCVRLAFTAPRWELRTQKVKSHLVRTQSLNVFPLKPGVGQYIAKHATLTARDPRREAGDV